MGVEPAFAQSTAAWHPAGLGRWPIEPDDPGFAIPLGALRICARDRAHKSYLADTSPVLAVPASEPLAPKLQATPRSRKWLAAVLASVTLHAAVAMFFITGGYQDEILIEGSADAGITMLGSAPEDQSAAGELSEIDPDTVTNVTMITMLDAKSVETIEAQAVPEPGPVEAVETAAQEAPATETIQPVGPLQPSPTEPLPEILATDTVEPVEDEDLVQKHVEMAEVEPVEADIAAIAPAPEQIVAEAEPPPVKPAEQPVKKAEPKPAKKPEKKVEQPKKADKPAAAKPKPANSGSGGKGQADARKGEADGAANGTTTVKGKNGSSASAGNAAVSNYPGKVAAKLRRALRGIARGVRAKARSDVHVTFTVGASGGVSGIRIVQSSGSPDLDAAALEVVRRAAPFPSIPPESGRSSWQFTLPLGLGR